ncbi:MAG: hypothetical protein FP825_13495 [Hyphomonas sp.]|uniref:hypothetical protein n=1 Tax=Hyphomonas sp. TaxID=87 RepID=UPI0017C76F44|nr:hypothetical protein [Hyphomonas sp.]MBA3069480.1 hypothetical protein [Hyphomonas sp.]MBU3920489.1 hypothetical protein [Alphaproteobacteria bacterium]MBU4063862.1 hypothetical protein [Alphaproteobacteria bacterium]
MRSVLLGVSLCVLAGCATVSVVPGEATFETSLTKNQSELREASNAYCEEVVTSGWIDESGGIASLADTLMHGKTEAAGSAGFYATRIGAETKAPALVLGRIVADSQAARSGLAEVTGEAEALLRGRDKTASNRGDVMSFERALVRAQMAHRGFQEALDLVSVRADMDVQPILAEIDSFAVLIDDARSIADRLAERYMSDGAAGS